MRLIYNNLWDLYTLTESQEDANYPVENTQDVRLAKVWRTETASAASVVISAGSAALAVFQATTNLVSDPEDLTTGNWTEVNCTASATSIIYDSKAFTKVTNVGANKGSVFQDKNALWTTLTPSFSVILRKGSSVGNVVRYVIRNTTGAVNIFYMPIDLDNYPNAPGTPQQGILHGYDWKDSETIEIRVICDALANLNDNIRISCHGSDNATDAEYTYWTAVQAEDLPYPTPYTATSRAVTHPDETFEMPSKFTIDMIVRPWFTYDTAIYHKFSEWYIDATHKFFISYDPSADLFYITWQDAGIAKYLLSQVFDDGTAEVDINQRIRIIASIDLTTGSTAGSRFIVMPLESGAIAEDITWSSNINPHQSTFPTFSRGHENDLLQADSQFEYQRIYAGTLVGAVADSAAADALLAEKDLILDLTDLNKLTADIATIINHNLSADATIKIQGNDYDTWEGTPLDTEMTWRDGPIVTFMTSASYPFWRFYIINQNVDDGYYEVGRFMLGEYLQVDPSSLVEFPEKHPRNDRQAFSKSNQFYADQGSGWKELKYKFVNSTDSMKGKIETMWNTIGKRKPILFMNYDTSFSVHEPIYVAIIKDITFGHLLHDRWEYNLEIRECD